MLTPEIQARILALHFGEGRSARAIALELKVDRKSVGVIIRERAVRIGAKNIVRASTLDPYKAQIREKLLRDPTIPSSAIFQAVRKLGFTRGARCVQDYVRVLRKDPRPKEAFLKLKFEPGECAQVDWGEFGDVFKDGRKIHAFLMVLCYSRKIYVEFTRAEKFEDFIRAHEQAFIAFGGVPKECWYDNLASAVTERFGKLIKFNARFLAYMGHHGITPYACNPARGNEKGRVEDGVKYLRSSFWAGRTFKDFDDLQFQCAEWLEDIANRREHRSTRKIPELLFKNEEKQHLLKLNPHPYDTDEVFSKTVPPQFHFTYDTNQYSVPWTLVGMVVTLRINANEFKAFYGTTLVACHKRSYLRDHLLTIPQHQAGLLERKEGGNQHAWQVEFVKNSGPSLKEYLQLVSAGHRSLRTEVQRLVGLITIYGAGPVDKAAADLLSRSVIGVDNLEMQLKTQGTTEVAPPPIEFKQSEFNRMTGIPNLSQYDTLLFDNHQQEELGE